MTSARTTLSISTLLGSLAAAAGAQTPIATFDGPGPAFRLGESVSTADVNADGFADVITGAPFANPSDDPLVFYLGQVSVFSGLDGSLLFSFDGDEVEDFVGASVAGLGDADGDGFEDFAVGATSDSVAGNGAPRTGVVRVFSGQTGALLFANGGDAGDQLGEVVAAAGDVNADGFADVIAGAPRALDLVGRAFVYSGVDGSVLHSFEGVGPDDFFGRSVGGAGDVDGDGFGDLIASAPSNKLDQGYARVYSGQTGAVLHDITGDIRAVAGAGDIDGDGFDDFLLSEPYVFPNARVRVLSGATGATLATFEETAEFTNFGLSIAGMGDVNGDAVPDVGVGARGQQFNAPAGFVSVFSGADGRVLYRITGGETELFGIELAAGDLDGDGFQDIVVGAPLADGGDSNSGTVSVYSGSPELGAVFCTSLVNSSGAVASLAARGSVAADPLNVRFDVGDLPASTQGLLFFGPNQLAGAPFGDGLRCVGGAVQRVLPPVSGMGAAQVVLNGSASYAATITQGADLAFQFWYRDNAAMMAGFNTSEARSLAFE